MRSTGVVTQQAVTRQRDEAAAAAGGGTALPAGQWWTAIGTAAAAVIVLTFAAVYLFNTTRRQSTQIQALEARLEQLAEKPAAQPTHHPSTTTSAPPPVLVPATRLPGNTWTSQFLNLANDPKRLASIAEAVMTEDETKRLPADVAKKLAKIRKGLAAGTAPGRNDRGLLLTILFQCLADQARMDDDAAFAIDGNFDGTPKQLQTRLKNQLRVDSRPGDDEQDEDFEAETILRWAEEKGR